MKINSIKNQINFGKTLVGKCSLPRQNHKKVECNLFQLSTPEDKDYFERVWDRKDWQDAKYVWDMDAQLNANIKGEKIYTMESQAGHCLGYLVMSPVINNPKEEELVILETCPKYQKKNENRTIKYIGETLLSFATGKLDPSKTRAIIIKNYSMIGRPFYKENCGFKECNDENGTLILKRIDFKKLASTNEEHTKSKIRYIG